MRNVLLAFCLAGLASAANAATIDFEEFAPINGSGSITSQGFTLTANGDYYGFNYAISDYAIYGSPANLSYGLCSDCTMTLEDSTGDLFSMSSAQISLGGSLFWGADSLAIIGYLAGGGTVQKSISGSIVVPNPPFVTVAFDNNWTNLERVEFDFYLNGYEGSGLIDNIVVAAVPVPPALLLFGSAIAGLIGFRRRARIR